MAINIGAEIFIEIKQVRQDEPKRFLSKEGPCLHAMSVLEARTQASAADAARTVQWDKKISPYPEATAATIDIGQSVIEGQVIA